MLLLGCGLPDENVRNWEFSAEREGAKCGGFVDLEPMPEGDYAGEFPCFCSVDEQGLRMRTLLVLQREQIFWVLPGGTIAFGPLAGREGLWISAPGKTPNEAWKVTLTATGGGGTRLHDK